jgi:outer membrane protein assembly factor BamB
MVLKTKLYVGFAVAVATALVQLAGCSRSKYAVWTFTGIERGPLSVVAVTTQHNDNSRTGANLRESILTTDAISRASSPGHLQRIFSRSVIGQIYAQPLYVPQLTMADGNLHNVVFVATMKNQVYAFDADEPKFDAPLWTVSLGASLPKDFMEMEEGRLGHNIDPDIGIASTPVIDKTTGTLFVSAKVCSSGGACHNRPYEIVYRLAAIDVRTGAIKARTDLTESNVSVDATQRRVHFDPRAHLQRPGLLLANEHIYLGFASHQDTEPFHGWLISVDERTLAVDAVFCTSCETGTDEVGIWQAGNGPAADEAGNVYVMTGNGPDNDRGGSGDLGNSFLKLSPDLKLLGQFVVAGQPCLNREDVDLGSAGPMLLPHTDFLVGGGKAGIVYVVRPEDMRLDGENRQRERRDGYLGGIQLPVFHAPWGERPCRSQPAEGPPWQVFQGAALWSNQFPGGTIADWFVTTMSYHHIHGSAVYWESAAVGPMIYLWPERDRVRGFRFDRSTRRFVNVTKPGQKPTADLVGPMGHKYGMPGGSLSISADGTRSGILWATLPLEGNALSNLTLGVVRAFDAATLELLWDSRVDAGVSFTYAKYVPPTIANGRVYIATFSNRLDVYGLVTR